MKEERDEKIIKDLLSKGSDISAPSNMSNLVLSAWKEESSPAVPYKPILPRWVPWMFVVGLIGLIVYALSISDQTGAPSRASVYLESVVSFFSGLGSSVSAYTLIAILALCLSMFAHAVVVNVKRRNLLAE